MSAETTRRALLEAAAAELADRGHDGVRLEHVAARAGVNKALIYRYFGDRDALFRAALAHRFAHREQILSGVPDALGDLLVYWTRQQASDPHFMRLILREALQHDGTEPVQADDRRAYYARQVHQIRALQAERALDGDLDPEMLFLALLAVVNLPATLPQICLLASGEAPGTAGFDERWEATLHGLAASLAP